MYRYALTLLHYDIRIHDLSDLNLTFDCMSPISAQPNKICALAFSIHDLIDVNLTFDIT